MIGILIVSHGAFGESLIDAASQMLGKPPLFVDQVGVRAHDDPDAILPRARERIRALDQGEGVLVLTDIPGATPSNVARRLLDPGKVEGVSGVSLPMLMRALTYRNEPLATVVLKALSASRECVVQMNPDSSDAANRS